MCCNHDFAGSSENAQKQQCDDPRPQLPNQYVICLGGAGEHVTAQA